MFQHIQNGLFEKTAVRFIQLVSGRIPFCQQRGGRPEHAAVGGVTLKARAQFDAKEGDRGVDAFRASGFPEFADLRRVQDARIETVFAGILIAFLPAAGPFFLTGLWTMHRKKIARGVLL